MNSTDLKITEFPEKDSEYVHLRHGMLPPSNLSTWGWITLIVVSLLTLALVIFILVVLLLQRLPLEYLWCRWRCCLIWRGQEVRSDRGQLIPLDNFPITAGTTSFKYRANQ